MSKKNQLVNLSDDLSNVGELHAEDSDHRQHGIAQGVAIDNGGVIQALGPCGADEIVEEHFQQVELDEARQAGSQVQREGAHIGLGHARFPQWSSRTGRLGKTGATRAR